MSAPIASPKITVVGLGYVGLPVAVALAKHFPVVGLDIDARRIEELRRGHDRTGEVPEEVLAQSRLQLTGEPAEGECADIYIVTVPTPVDTANRPDLTALEQATRTVGGLIDRARCPIIVYESTVYPGVTEDVCGAILAGMGLERGRDFRLGYSPERINPGDREHHVETIIKVVAGEDQEVLEELARIYGAINNGRIFKAASIKAAEAAKVIENAQRDINIAFMNEVAQIAQRVDLSVWDVLAAARTKWNFLPFEPGLVGGHCIGVDPFYLSHLAEQVGIAPEVVLAGRGKNDGMATWIADQVHARRAVPGDVLILGATFKENVPDLRNSKVANLAARFAELGHRVRVVDPVAEASELAQTYPAAGTSDEPADIVVGAVPHDQYRAIAPDQLSAMVREGGLVADIKGIWRELSLRDDIERWTL